MTTEEQGREWLLRKLYDRGYKYIYIDDDDDMFITKARLPVVNPSSRYLDETNRAHLLPIDIKLYCGEDFIDIAQELGIIDWSKVPVDTPVIVWSNGWQKKRRYFAKYENGRVYTWDYGATSWTSDTTFVSSWDNARLAEVDKE